MTRVTRLTRMKSIFSPTRYRPCDCLSTQNLFGHLQGGSSAICLTWKKKTKRAQWRRFRGRVKKTTWRLNPDCPGLRRRPAASPCFSCWGPPWWGSATAKVRGQVRRAAMEGGAAPGILVTWEAEEPPLPVRSRSPV